MINPKVRLEAESNRTRNISAPRKYMGLSTPDWLLSCIFIGTVSWNLLLAGCCERRNSTQMNDPTPALSLESDPNLFVGKLVIVEGFAENLKAGAVILLKNDSGYFIGEFQGWPNAFLHKQVRAKGTLRISNDRPAFVGSNGEPISGGAWGKRVRLDDVILLEVVQTNDLMRSESRETR